MTVYTPGKKTTRCSIPQVKLKSSKSKYSAAPSPPPPAKLEPRQRRRGLGTNPTVGWKEKKKLVLCLLEMLCEGIVEYLEYLVQLQHLFFRAFLGLTIPFSQKGKIPLHTIRGESLEIFSELFIWIVYRLSWLTNSVLVYEPKYGGGGRVAGSQLMSTTVHTEPQINFGDLTPYF